MNEGSQKSCLYVKVHVPSGFLGTRAKFLKKNLHSNIRSNPLLIILRVVINTPRRMIQYVKAAVLVK